MAITLKDGAGTAVTPTTCTSADATSLSVSPDCSSVTGHRIGVFKITVNGAGGVSQEVSVKVIPQRVAIATNLASSFGGDYNVVVAPSGKVLAWGANTFGVLGQGQDATKLVYKALPVTVKDSAGTGELGGIVAASAGETAVLALTEEGEVYSWGWGTALPFTNKSEIALPVKVPNAANTGNLNHIVAVSAGDNNCIALADDGTVYTWGWFGGHGGSGGDSTVYPAQVKSTTGAGVLQNIVAVAAGSGYSLALTADGHVAAWGYNGSGVAGTSSATTVQTLPLMIKLALDGTELTDMMSLSAGNNFALALGSNGKVYAWGSNSYGQMGQGVQYGTYVQAVVVKDTTGAADLSGISVVSAGGTHALALDSTGKVFSWGFSSNGDLGDGPNHPRGNQGLLPAAVVNESGIGQLAGMTGIATGYTHSLGLAPDGSLRIWGSGLRGNLAQGDAVNLPDSPVPLTVKDEAGTAALSLAPLTVTRSSYRRYR